MSRTRWCWECNKVTWEPGPCVWCQEPSVIAEAGLGPQSAPDDYRIFNRPGNTRPLSEFFDRPTLPPQKAAEKKEYGNPADPAGAASRWPGQ